MAKQDNQKLSAKKYFSSKLMAILAITKTVIIHIY